jgi:hypothetical protein
MALFIDGSISALDDLAAQDSQLLDVASQEGINVTQKIGLAQDQISLDLVSMLHGLRSSGWPAWLVQEPALGNIVVTPPMKLWHTYLSLEMVYQDAYNDQLNDRYGAKRDQFHQLAGSAREKLIQIGVGIAANPVPQAATPLLFALPGSLPDGPYYVTIAWVNQIGEEGASAVPDAITTSSSTFGVQTGTPPQQAAGWNVYVGPTPQSMVIQNTALLPLGESWQQPSNLATSGAAPGNGQKPTYLKPLPRVTWRG